MTTTTPTPAGIGHSQREQLARSWYRLRPATRGGRVIPFDQAPPMRRAWSYNQADTVLKILHPPREEAA